MSLTFPFAHNPHPYSHTGRKLYTPLVHANSELSLHTRAHYNKLRRSHNLYQGCVAHWAYQLAFRSWVPRLEEKMEEIKKELVKEGEGKPELVVEGEAITKVKSTRTGDFPGKNLPDLREYSGRCPRTRSGWLRLMEQRYGIVSEVGMSDKEKNDKGKYKAREERKNFSERLEPIPLTERPPRYIRYCLAKSTGRAFEDSDSSEESSDDGDFKMSVMESMKATKPEQEGSSAECGRKSTTFERDGEDGSGNPSSGSSGKTKMQKFLGQFSSDKKAPAPNVPPPSVPTYAKEKGESSERPPSRSDKTATQESYREYQGTERANTFPPSRSLGRARGGLPSPWTKEQENDSLSVNDFSTPRQHGAHFVSSEKMQTYIPTHVPKSSSNTRNDSSQSLPKASSTKAPANYNLPLHFRPHPLPPMPSDVRKILQEVDRDNKEVESYVPCTTPPLLSTPTPEEGEDHVFGGMSRKGKQKLDELRTACGARLDRVAQEAAKKTIEKIRREREIAEDKVDKQEGKEGH